MTVAEENELHAVFYGDLNIPLPSPGLHPGEPAAVVLLPGEPGTVGGAAHPGQSAGATQLSDNTNTYQHISTHINTNNIAAIV